MGKSHITKLSGDKGTASRDNRGMAGYDINQGGKENGTSIERLRSEERARKLSIPFQAALDVYRGNGGTSRENLEAIKRYATEKGLIEQEAYNGIESEGAKDAGGFKAQHEESGTVESTGNTETKTDKIDESGWERGKGNPDHQQRQSGLIPPFTHSISSASSVL